MNEKPKKPIPLDYARPRMAKWRMGLPAPGVESNQRLTGGVELKEPVEVFRSEVSGDVAFVVRELGKNGINVQVEAHPLTTHTPAGLRIVFVEAAQRDAATQLVGKILTRRDRMKKLPRQNVKGIDDAMRDIKPWGP